MKLGFVSSILDKWSFEEMMDFAAEHKFDCVEVACWPREKALRRYAGVSHIDIDRVLSDDSYVTYIQDYSRQKCVEISALAYYPNPLSGDPEGRINSIRHLKNVIRASGRLGIGMVTTFIGRDQRKNVSENMEIVREVWPDILSVAEQYHVRVAIENCPMLFDENQWPGGQNIMTSPDNWRRVFEILDSPWIGLNFDPSHFVWQMMDYIDPIYEFRNKIFHVHCKDIKIYVERLRRCGTMANPLEYMSPKLPGLGDVDWGRYISALTDVGYEGYTCIEIEDRAFEETKQRIADSLILSQRYLQQFII